MRLQIPDIIFTVSLALWPFTIEAGADDPLPYGVRSDYSGACSSSASCTRKVFLDLAFPISGDGTAKTTQLHKWVKPISITFAAKGATTSQDHIEDIEWEFDHIVTTLSSIEIDVSHQPFPSYSDRPTIFVLGFEQLKKTIGDMFPALATIPAAELSYSTAAHWFRSADDQICTLGVAWNKAHELIGATILFDLKRSVDDIAGCLPSIMASAMGFLGTPSIAGLESALNVNFRRQYLTLFDKLLLQILNDDFIKPGMTEAEVRAVFPQVYAHYRPWRLRGPVAVEEIDRETLSCMASVDCAREHFLEMAVTGSNLEPKTLEQRVLIKLEIPTAIALVEGDDIRPEQLEAALTGYRDALALAKALRLPLFSLRPHYPPPFAGIRAYVSQDFEAESRERVRLLAHERSATTALRPYLGGCGSRAERHGIRLSRPFHDVCANQIRSPFRQRGYSGRRHAAGHNQPLRVRGTRSVFRTADRYRFDGANALRRSRRQ